MVGSGIRPRSQHRPQAVHTPVDAAFAGSGPTVSPMRQTPIYEQLRGECINADVPPSEADPSRVGHPGRHRRLADTTGPPAVCAPLGPAADVGAHGHPLLGIADQPPGATQRTAAMWGPRAAVPCPAHAPQTPAHAAGSSATSTGTYDPADVASGGGADQGPVVKPRQNQRTNCSPAATPQREFPWFEPD